jgi:DNA-binding transcriptional ArsR family regulator
MFRPLDALLTRTQQGVLAATVLKPEKGWYLSDLARHLNVRPSSIQRDLAALTKAGILARRKDGNRVYFQPDPLCPFLADVRGLLTKTVGIADVLRDALTPVRDKVRFAAIFGSVAKGAEDARSDIDLLIVGDAALSDIAPLLAPAEEALGRTVSAVVYSPEEFAEKRDAHFLSTVLGSALIPLMGHADFLEGREA